MKIVQASEKRWRGDQLRHRKGKILIKRLIEGEAESPENYGLHIGRESAEFFSPRHRHPWDQIRYCISGSVPIAPHKTLDHGEVGYFPEGLHYGPQKGPEGVNHRAPLLQVAHWTLVWRASFVQPAQEVPGLVSTVEQLLW